MASILLCSWVFSALSGQDFPYKYLRILRQSYPVLEFFCLFICKRKRDSESSYPLVCSPNAHNGQGQGQGQGQVLRTQSRGW